MWFLIVCLAKLLFDSMIRLKQITSTLWLVFSLERFMMGKKAMVILAKSALFHC